MCSRLNEPAHGRICSSRQADEDAGFVSVWLAVAVALVLGGACLVVLVAADVNVAASRARTAADAAALAAMAASPVAGGTGDPVDAAEALAAANGAAVVDVDRRGWPFRFALTVRVPPRAALLRTLAPTAVMAEAAAGVRPAAASPASNRSRAGSLGQVAGRHWGADVRRPGRGYAGRDP